MVRGPDSESFGITREWRIDRIANNLSGIDRAKRARSIVAGRDCIENSGRPAGAQSVLQCRRRTTLVTTPRVVDDMRRLGWIRVLARDICRSDEPLHAFHVSRNSASSLSHVAASNPFRFRRHADGVGATVITDHRAHRMRTVVVVVAGLSGVAVANGVRCVNRVVPIVTVVRSLRARIPTTVLSLDGGVLPRNTCVSAGYYCSLARDPFGPSIVGIDIDKVAFRTRIRGQQGRCRVSGAEWFFHGWQFQLTATARI